MEITEGKLWEGISWMGTVGQWEGFIVNSDLEAKPAIG
jgi:hypothetical protein